MNKLKVKLTEAQSHVVFRCLKGTSVFVLKGMFWMALNNQHTKREWIHGNVINALVKKNLLVLDGEQDDGKVCRYVLNKPVLYGIILQPMNPLMEQAIQIDKERGTD